jgi:hypothetical protein
MDTTTRSHSVQSEQAADSLDRSIAAARRVQHLSAIVASRLTTPDQLEPNALAKAVVKALYEIHPHIRLDDGLELAVLVETPPDTVSTRRAIEHVVDDACTHLTEWGRFETPRQKTPQTEVAAALGADITREADGESNGDS